MSLRFLRNATAVLFMQLAAIQAGATGEGWLTNVADAIQKAQLENKDLLFDFSGSDWCHWCIQLDKEVFTDESFQDEVSKSFVLVELDFPNDSSKLSEAVQKQNQQWREKLQIEGFPTVVLIDSRGLPYAKTGYQEGGPEAYLDHLSELQEVRIQRDRALTAAAAVDGLEKAKLLDEALQAVGPELAFTSYLDTVKSIIQLDSDNSGGFKEKYKSGLDRIQIGKELQTIMQQFQPGQAADYITKLTAIETRYAPTGRLRMELRGILAQMYVIAGQEDEALAIAEEFVKSQSIHPEQLVQWKLLQSAAYAKQDRADDAISVLDAIMQEHRDNLQVVMHCTVQKVQTLVRSQRGDEATEFLNSRLVLATGQEKAILEQLSDRLEALLQQTEDAEAAAAEEDAKEAAAATEP